jgi:O-antigen/teichoic acid export membrane protein
MPRIPLILDRLLRSAVVWSWGFNALRLAGGILLLPLILRELPSADLGMYYVLLSIMALVPIVDFGFSPTIGRFVSYAMGGAERLQPQGVAAVAQGHSPNYRLLWELLIATRAFYRLMAIAILLVAGMWGTYIVELRIEETSSTTLTRMAWILTLVSCAFDVFSSWWSVYLRGMNQVLSATRILVLAHFIKLLTSAALLLAGLGLSSIPIGTIAGSIIQMALARRTCLQQLKHHPRPDRIDIKEQLRILWPNSWRLGVQLLSGYLTINANTAVCVHVLGLHANAKYGLSIQLMNIALGMAAVWTAVKWPVIGQLRARHDYSAVQRVFWPRYWLQNLTFLILGSAVILLAPELLTWFGTDKTLVAMPWLFLLGVNAFLEMQFTLWGTLISTENRLPFLWPSVVSNVLSLGLSLTLIHTTELGLGALVLGPLIAGSLFNYWYWPFAGAQNIKTRLWPFLLRRLP